MAVRVNGNAEHMFNTDIDGGGKFNITRLGFNHDATFTATEELRVTFGSSYNFYHFDFSGSEGFAGLRPWRNVSISNNSMRVSYALTNNWGVFVTPMISYGAESGAPFWDSFTIGAIAGANYTIGPNFTIGIGGFVGSRLEQSVIGYPIGFIDWRITEPSDYQRLQAELETISDPRQNYLTTWEEGLRWPHPWAMSLRGSGLRRKEILKEELENSKRSLWLEKFHMT